MNKLSVLLLLSLLGCPKDPVTPTPEPDDPETVTQCSAAEKNLLALGCKDSGGSLVGGNNKKGESFASVCKTAQTNKVDLNPKCLAKATSCSEITKCGR